MTVYSFKPALVRSVQSWKIEDGHLSKDSETGIDLSNLSAVRRNETYANRMMNATLTLESESTKLTIVCNDRPRGENRTAYLRLSEEIFAMLAESSPDLDITVGYPRIVRILVALSGAFLFAVGVIIALSANSSPGSVSIFILGSVLAMAGIGVILFVAPWKEAATKPLKKALDEIRSELGRV